MSRLKKIAYTEGKYELVDITDDPSTFVFSYKLSDELEQQQVDEAKENFWNSWLCKQLMDVIEKTLTNNKELRHKIYDTHIMEFEFYEDSDCYEYGKDNSEYNLTGIKDKYQFDEVLGDLFEKNDENGIDKLIKVPALMSAIGVEFCNNPNFELDTTNKLLYMKRY